MNPSKQTIADVAMIAAKAIDRIIYLESKKLGVGRTWVGLTDDEIVLISADCAATHQHMDIQFARAIEARLKAKNT